MCRVECILISPGNLCIEWKSYWPDAPAMINSYLISISCALAVLMVLIMLSEKNT